jgi:hypothetical protein
LASREYPFEFHVPKEGDSLKLVMKVRYHIQTEGQHQMLIDKYGLTAKDPYHFTVYERAAPLIGKLAASFDQAQRDSHLACAAPGHS